MIKQTKNNVPCTFEIEEYNGEKTVGKFYKKELQKTNKIGYGTEKVIKRKGDKLYVEQKGYDNLLVIWIEKNYIIM